MPFTRHFPTINCGHQEASKGYLIAWDPVKAREVWRVEHKGAWNGGTLATAGGIVFPGTIDASSRWTPVPGRSSGRLRIRRRLAGPITVNGEQYVTVLSGYGSVYVLTSSLLSPIEPSRLNGRVHVYKLGMAYAPAGSGARVYPDGNATRHQGVGSRCCARCALYGRSA